MDTEDPLLAAARNFWERLANVPGCFQGRAPVSVVESPESKLCPPGWVGVVRIADRALVTVPTESVAHLLTRTCAGRPIAGLTDDLPRELKVADILGPAWLAYVDADRFLPQQSQRVSLASRVEAQRLLETVSDGSESGIGTITSPAFVVRQDVETIAAAGYREWLGLVAHMSVLTAEHMRGIGLGRTVASAATAHALRRGLLPQWRARPMASRRVAKSLGYEEVGAQVSFRLNERTGP